MKERKLKKYRCWFKCPYLVSEKDCVTDDPYPIYQETTYCKLGRFYDSGYSGYGSCHEGISCETCKLPINRKQMHEVLQLNKKYARLEKAYDRAWKKVKKIKTVVEASFLENGPYTIEEPDESDPNFEKLLEAESELNTFWREYRNE